MLYLCTSIKSRSHRLTHQPSIRMPRWSRYDAGDYFSLQKDPIMVKNPIYKQFAEHFASASIQSLVDTFNHEVGNKGWAGMRSLYDKALVDEFIRRGIDISVVYDGRSISFAHLVNYDSSRNRLIAVG